MKILKKLKQLIGLSKNKKLKADVIENAASEVVLADDTNDEYLYPLTRRVIQWLETQQWKYEHRTPVDDKRIHHLLLGFAMMEKGRSDWLCVIRVNESNQLISMFGIIEEPIAEAYYPHALLAISKANIGISYGNLELDIDDGEFRAKLSFDAEFTKLTDMSLGSNIQTLYNLVGVIDDIKNNIKKLDYPMKFEELIKQNKKDNNNHDDTDGDNVFFMPTKKVQ